jgi:hypothetical protein
MASVKNLCAHFVRREEAAWQERDVRAYTLEICGMIDEIHVLPHHEEQADVLTDLAFACFNRSGEGQVVDALGRIADLALHLSVKTFNPETRFRLALLFIQSWSKLALDTGHDALNHLGRLASDVVTVLDGLLERRETKQAFLDLLVQTHGLPDAIRNQLKP